MNAADTYASQHAQALALLDQIRDMIEDMPAPSDMTNWAHVGDMGMIVAQLAAIANPEI